MSTPVVPSIPLIDQPEQWPQIVQVVATVHLEAENQPDAGKLAVAWTIRNRMDAWKIRDVARVVFGPDGVPDDRSEPYSCWNPDGRGRTVARLTTASGPAYEASWRAGVAAYWKLQPDPTSGCTHYLNVALTRKIRGDGTVPPWAEACLASGRFIVFGDHTFMRPA